MFVQNQKEPKTFQIIETGTKTSKMVNLYVGENFVTITHSLRGKKNKSLFIATTIGYWLFYESFLLDTTYPRQPFLSGFQISCLLQVSL